MSQQEGLDPETKAELKKLWESAVEVSYLYYVRLADASVNLAEAIPGLKVLVQDGDGYVVEIPEASRAALQALEDAGKIPDPSDEQVNHLSKLYNEWLAANGKDGRVWIE